jgi:hypothetical protein
VNIQLNQVTIDIAAGTPKSKPVSLLEVYDFPTTTYRYYTPSGEELDTNAETLENPGLAKIAGTGRLESTGTVSTLSFVRDKSNLDLDLIMQVCFQGGRHQGHKDGATAALENVADAIIGTAVKMGLGPDPRKRLLDPDIGKLVSDALKGSGLEAKVIELGKDDSAEKLEAILDKMGS